MTESRVRAWRSLRLMMQMKVGVNEALRHPRPRKVDVFEQMPRLESWCVCTLDFDFTRL